MTLKRLALAGAISVMGSSAFAACSYENTTEIKMLSAGFEAWKAVADAMSECGNFKAELDQEFRTKQPAAFEANPSLYHLGGVSNGTVTPLLNAKTIRPLDDLVAKYGANLSPNQLIRIDGKIMAVAMMVNTQHLMYREDILADLDIATPTSWDEVYAAAAKIKDAGVVDYPLGATMKSGWNLAQEFVNMYPGFGGALFKNDNTTGVNSDAGLKALETMKAGLAFMDPEVLVSDSTYVQQQFQQGKIAMANLWASRAAAMNDEAESQVAGKIKMAAAPTAMAGGAPATTLWWDGIVVAANITDAEADAAFKLAMEGMDSDMVQANNDAAIWLVQGFQPGPLSQGAIATATANPAPPAYPSTTQMGLLHTVLGNEIPAFLTGERDAAATLVAIEEAYTTAAKEAGVLK
ncbi:extracellular solute-binding protein [Sulfitobacter sp. M57]|uniref:ABC transporter substrate-binding protein n=1 Tax=unclassified Sulfitobacter TaxID=196795 RepID=UPI0023E29D90|nr:MULTISPECIES: extracellular solute-binding protein [unclassified Sulfitobacter]MDF3415695.1 extracellular solute-binding protein [Sulfitobacter sp. KE5]MDF3423175.1 extracellular solute-binding protein [Sulfitobacter sp. KE43]MDF3434241.1 extracellular solute-binding protein [Sulfitobacter sp. KE42]MDF3459726.1 extracellular solute-binding protein [Sulfitobacter sp. S74]MDF3463779.1 extracellular solute-binding protein [Sulfitobacter sp. Ks18]